MKKVIRCLTISATGILVLSNLALLIAIILQTPLIEMTYGEDLYFVQEGFSIPFNYLFLMFALVLTSAVLCFTAGNERFSFGTEIIGAVLIAFGIPVISDVINGVQNYILVWYFSDASLARQNLVTSVCSHSLTFVHFATALVLVACGMSIAYKYLTRKAAKDTICE